MDFLFRWADLCSAKMADQYKHYQFEAIKDKINNNIIEPPKISEAEIVDRSKGDIISKTVVILQTTWFISQYIARLSTGIPVTELEVLTLGLQC